LCSSESARDYPEHYQENSDRECASWNELNEIDNFSPTPENQYIESICGIFISHIHEDEEAAKAISSFLNDKLNGQMNDRIKGQTPHKSSARIFYQKTTIKYGSAMIGWKRYILL
jgi:hypothetical protein